MTIVLLSGKQGAGKTAIQNKLLLAAGRAGFEAAYALNFADGLYAIHDIVNYGLKELGIVPKSKKDRVLLQLLGTEWGRKVYGENIWVRMLKQKISDLRTLEQKALVIVGDCRFENEFDAFPEALRVRLVAAEHVRRARAISFGDPHHASETQLDCYAYNGLFDMNLRTDGNVGPDGTVELILAQLQKSNWRERRGAWVEVQSLNGAPNA
ncbi:MAG: hypothetical protein RBT63_00475 [Bdellovibrionales bacterium]|jgi:hypothetical protein|nr:hypothetical protein [Bdellovibrionales bacterium]